VVCAGWCATDPLQEAALKLAAVSAMAMAMVFLVIGGLEKSLRDTRDQLL